MRALRCRPSAAFSLFVTAITWPAPALARAGLNADTAADGGQPPVVVALLFGVLFGLVLAIIRIRSRPPS